jgi:hypothetical protein
MRVGVGVIGNGNRWSPGAVDCKRPVRRCRWSRHGCCAPFASGRRQRAASGSSGGGRRRSAGRGERADARECGRKSPCGRAGEPAGQGEQPAAHRPRPPWPLVRQPEQLGPAEQVVGEAGVHCPVDVGGEAAGGEVREPWSLRSRIASSAAAWARCSRSTSSSGRCGWVMKAKYCQVANSCCCSSRVRTRRTISRSEPTRSRPHARRRTRPATGPASHPTIRDLLARAAAARYSRYKALLTRLFCELGRTENQRETVDPGSELARGIYPIG